MEDTTNIFQNNTESGSSVSSHDFKSQIEYKEQIKAWQIQESQIFKWLCLFTIGTSLSAVTAIYFSLQTNTHNTIDDKYSDGTGTLGIILGNWVHCKDTTQ